MASWSDLSSEMLEHVTSFLPVADKCRFSAVSRDCLLVAKQKSYPPAAELPWLVLGEDEITKKRNFYSMSEKRHYAMDIPELYGQYICGSSHGWLFTVDEKLSGRLLNPFTRECYQLPPYPPFTDEKQRKIRRRWTTKETQTKIVLKGILSHDPKEKSDFTAMIIFGEYCRLAIWRPDDISWTPIYPKQTIGDIISFPLMDIICFKGKIYGISASMGVWAIDFGYGPKITKIMTLKYSIDKPIWRYFVEFKGELLLVERFMYTYITVCRCDPTDKLLVSRVDVDERIYGTWEYGIHDHALFVGNNSPVVIDSRMALGCMKNGIYFTDVCNSYFWLLYGHDSGVYNMLGRTVEQFCPNDDNRFQPRNAALTWFTPNP